MDLASLIGLIAGIVFTLLTIVFNGDAPVDSIMAFVDAGSIMIVIGGVFASILIANPLDRVIKALLAAKMVFLPPKFDHTGTIENIINLSNLARREGVLALEESAQSMDDPFLQKGIMLVVDGADPELVRSVLETEMVYMENRHNDIRSLWDMAAAMAPAWGMVGTMVALVLMMGNLQDIELLAQNMALAMITTFYGALVANFIASPISRKLQIFNAQEMLLKEVQIEGMLSIQNGENPRIIEEKLKAFLAPSLRKASTEGGGDA
ncbi:MAG: motility protein A [Defluviitaleaceae bacterium]|nr:motility protein A [Defluviitaleaceae bacterium]